MKKTIAKSNAVPDWAIYLLLSVATLAVYGQVRNYAFLELDDVQAIPANPQVRDGFNWGGILWAFSTGYAANWFPVTWLSHMLDCQLFGLDAGWHHLTNVLIHTVDSVFLFTLVKRMTGRLWESAFVAFVFALHPLHVESVAWVSERKDVLFAFFWFLTTWLYLDFVEQRTLRRYLLMVAAFCLGLMSKQVIVTLPFTLLLLDVWPLRRVSEIPLPEVAAPLKAAGSGRRFPQLILEKVPLVALAIAASVITILMQRQGGAVQSLQEMSFPTRAANALVSYVAYLANFVWPVGLAAFYPYPFHLPAWQVASAALVLIAISVLAMTQFRARPYLAVGWFWYLGTLAPVIGLIQVGYQSRADRYTYVPLIGISIMIAFAWPKRFAPAAAIIVCSFWLVTTWIQVGYWQDGVTLHRHSIAVTARNYRAHEDLGVELAKRGDYQQALRELYTSVEENPDQAHARNTLGAILFHLGRKEEAIEQYTRGIQIDPQGALLHMNLGNTLADVGRTDDAIRELNTAIRLKPGMAAAYFALGRVLVIEERQPEAIRCFKEVLRLEPDYPQAREQLDALRGFRVKKADRAIYLFLFVTTVLVYSQVSRFAFLSFDDNQGLLANPQVRDGFSLSGLAWAFSTGYASNWFPVTWISHMLDFQLFGLDAGWHHLTNVLIHAVSAVLLFALMRRMTGRKWESAFVAFVFAFHPLHVESVAWVSERKDVLFAFFWFLTTWLYLDFVEKRTVAKYLLMLAAFCLGLMSKQMIVTLPFTLLLLDAWPLRRGWLEPRPSEAVARGTIPQLILEKAPLVALAIAASAIAFLAQKKGGAVQSLDAIPLAMRAANAAMAYVIYIANFIWPAGLAFFYPYPSRYPVWEITLAVIAISVVSVTAVLAFRARPYLAVGWFWYVGTLAPVIGLIQVGHQARADRYTYIPLVGIAIMLAWSAAELPRRPAAVLAIAACLGWTFVTWVQISYWKDSAALYNRAIAVTGANYLAHLNLGVDLAAQGDYQRALRELFTSIEQNPNQPHARNSLGSVLYNVGRKDEAMEQFTEAIRLEPDDAEPHSNLGNALVDAGKPDDAIRELNTALRLNPGMANAYFGLGRALVAEKRQREAVQYFSEALRINPNFVQAKDQLRALGATR